MPQQVLMQNLDRYRFTTNLGGQDVHMTVWYQPSDENWYLTLRVNADIVKAGVKLQPFARPFANLDGFDGELVVFGNVALGRYPWDDHYLIYYSPDEIDNA